MTIFKKRTLKKNIYYAALRLQVQSSGVDGRHVKLILKEKNQRKPWYKSDIGREQKSRSLNQKLHLIYHLLVNQHPPHHPMCKSKQKKWQRMPNIIKTVGVEEAGKSNKIN